MSDIDDFEADPLPDMPGGTSSDEETPVSYRHKTAPRASAPGGARKGNSRFAKPPAQNAPSAASGGGGGAHGGFDSIEEFNLALMVRVEMLEGDLATARAEADLLRENAGPGVPPRSSATPTDAGAARDLARKVRSLTHALGKERGRAAVLERERDRWRGAFERASASSNSNSGSSSNAQGPRGSRSNAGSVSGGGRFPSARSSGGSASARSASAGQDAAGKVSELRAQLDIARAESASLTRVLEKELGDGVTVSDALAAQETGWRGRAEKISLLKEQLRRARASAGDGAAGGTVAGSEATGAPASVSAATERQMARIGGIETNRQREIDRLLVEATERDSELERLRSRSDAASARVAALERDGRKARDRIAVLVSKSKDDDELIATLKKGLLEAAASKSKSGSKPSSSGTERTVSRDIHDRLKEKYAELCHRVETQERMIESLQRRMTSAGDKTNTPSSPGGGDKTKEKSESLFDPDPSAAHFAGLPSGVAAAIRAYAGGEIALLQRRTQALDDLAAHLRAKVEESEQRETELRGRLAAAERKAGEAGKGKNRGKGATESELEERCEFLASEVDALKLSLRGAAQRREKEMQMYRDVAEEARAMCEETLAEIARQAGVA